MNDFFLELRRKLPDFFNDGRFHCYLRIFRGSGHAVSMALVISCKPVFDLSKCPDVYKAACDRCRSRHLWTDEVRTSTFALSAFKIPIRRAGTTLSRHQGIWIHAEAHATTGFAPFKARFTENVVESFCFRLAFDSL